MFFITSVLWQMVNLDHRVHRKWDEGIQKGGYIIVDNWIKNWIGDGHKWTQVKPGDDVLPIDKGLKNKWCWSWIEGRDREPSGSWCKKLRAWCLFLHVLLEEAHNFINIVGMKNTSLTLS